MTQRTSASGLAFALLAYGSWGLFPIYWKQLAHVAAAEVLAHRIVGSFVFVLLLLLLRRRGRAALAILAHREGRRMLLLSTCLISINWGLFIWAVSRGRITDASLGYYINPLFNALLGRLVLKESLGPRRLLAIALAGAGVLLLTLVRGGLPWISLVLASTFALYGLVRKRAPAGALEGLAIETGLSTPLALLFLLSLQPAFGQLATGDHTTRAWILGAGVATAIPLLAFAAAARRLEYTTLGMTQFLAPTMQLACAVILYGEPFGRGHKIAFSLIWGAIALYLYDVVAGGGRSPKLRQEPTEAR